MALVKMIISCCSLRCDQVTYTGYTCYSCHGCLSMLSLNFLCFPSLSDISSCLLPNISEVDYSGPASPRFLAIIPISPEESDKIARFDVHSKSDSFIRLQVNTKTVGLTLH